jgi:hypothetical protein
VVSSGIKRYKYQCLIMDVDESYNDYKKSLVIEELKKSLLNCYWLSHPLCGIMQESKGSIYDVHNTFTGTGHGRLGRWHRSTIKRFMEQYDAKELDCFERLVNEKYVKMDKKKSGRVTKRLQIHLDNFSMHRTNFEKYCSSIDDLDWFRCVCCQRILKIENYSRGKLLRMKREHRALCHDCALHNPQKHLHRRTKCDVQEFDRGECEVSDVGEHVKNTDTCCLLSSNLCRTYLTPTSMYLTNGYLL